MTDDGLTFFATIQKRTCEELHRETPNRLEFLDWLGAHYEEGDALTITIEARGAAALATALGLAVGAQRMAGKTGH